MYVSVAANCNTSVEFGCNAMKWYKPEERNITVTLALYVCYSFSKKIISAVQSAVIVGSVCGVVWRGVFKYVVRACSVHIRAMMLQLLCLMFGSPVALL